jgi:hypothetical protein
MVAASVLGGCSSASPAAAPAGGDAGDGTGADAGTGCVTYAPMTITTMRNPAAPGCYELAHVALVARTSSTKTPRLYVQDPKGGDYSAIMAKCSATSAHACSATALATSLQLLNGASVTLRGYYEHGKISGFEEFYIESVTDDGAMLPVPAPITLTVADLGRDARVPAKWFQKATVNVAPADTLAMYDFSPPEFALNGPCPAWEGFGMIASSVMKPSPATCAGAKNPAGQTAADPKEILIGRQFFHRFTYSSDCGCAATHSQVLLTAANTVSGAISGVLILEILKGSKAGFQVFEPTSKTEFPIQ